MNSEIDIFSIHNSIIECKELLYSFNNALEKVIGNPFFVTSSEILAKIFKNLSNKAEIVLSTSANNIEEIIQSDNLNDKSILKQDLARIQLEVESENIKKLIVYFRTLASYIRYIESSSIDEVPISLWHYYDSLIKNVDKGFFIILRRQWKPNFKYAEFINQLSNVEYIPKSLLPIFENVNIRIATIAYPILEKDNYFLLTNLAHEVGHCFDEICPFIETVSEKFEQNENAVKIAFHWINELVVDVYATLIMGYAYLFSLLTFQNSVFDLDQSFVSLNIQEDNYPSLRMRLYFITKTLDKYYKDDLIILGKFEENIELNNWMSAFKEEVDKIIKLTKVEDFINDSAESDEIKKLQKEAWEISLSLEESLIKHAHSFFKKNKLLLNYKDLDRETIFHVKQKINLNIPINELVNEGYKTQYLEPPFIMLFGWIEYLNLIKKYGRLKESEEKKSLLSDIIVLKKLIKRSIEASTFHKAFINMKDLFS